MPISWLARETQRVGGVGTGGVGSASVDLQPQEVPKNAAALGRGTMKWMR